MPPIGPGAARPSADAVDAVLRDLRDLGSLGRLVHRGEAPERSAPERRSTGVEALDHLLDGGIPTGSLVEIVGPTSSGHTALVLALLASATGRRESAAVVDVADAFDPASAAACGVALARVLWARPPPGREALRAADLLLTARGFGLVVLDSAEPLPRAAVLRLARAAARSGTSLVVPGTERRVGTSADLVLELGAPRARFVGTPPLLEAVESEVTLVRNRAGPVGGRTAMRLRGPALP